MYIPLSTSDGWHQGIYGSINLKKIMKPSFDQPKNISEDQTRNPNFFLHQASDEMMMMKKVSHDDGYFVMKVIL